MILICKEPWEIAHSYFRKKKDEAVKHHVLIGGCPDHRVMVNVTEKSLTQWYMHTKDGMLTNEQSILMDQKLQANVKFTNRCTVKQTGKKN